MIRRHTPIAAPERCNGIHCCPFAPSLLPRPPAHLCPAGRVRTSLHPRLDSHLLLTLLRSFFTAIYLNGAPISSNQESCGNMGQPSYCCASGRSCAWDDGGKVACCASGSSCQGSAYGQGAGAGAGQYYGSSSSSWYPQPQTTTVYQNGGGGGVVPIVPVTVATVLTPSTTTTYYQVPTSTYPQYTQTTTTTLGAAVAGVTTSNNVACPSGYKTFTEANVGAPVRTVGCNVIINSGAWRVKGEIREAIVMIWILGSMRIVLWAA